MHQVVPDVQGHKYDGCITTVSLRKKERKGSKNCFMSEYQRVVCVCLSVFSIGVVAVLFHVFFILMLTHDSFFFIFCSDSVFVSMLLVHLGPVRFLCRLWFS